MSAIVHSAARRVRRVSACVPLALLALGACTHISPATPSRTRLTATELESRADYARLERDVLAELNRLRNDPRGYAPRLEEMLGRFRGQLYFRSGSSVGVRTREGVSAVHEAVQALRAQGTLPTLRASEGLSMAARDHALDQGRRGSIGHRGSDGSRAMHRASRYGQWSGRMSESIAYGRFTSGADVVMMLVVDDGVPDRGHRRNALDRSARIAGVACAPHARYGSVCVINQVSAYQEQYATR